MGKIIFYLLIIAGLCFSQSIESAYDADVSLIFSRRMYLKPMAQMNYQVDEMAFNNPFYKPIPNAFALLTQVEGETLQPKRSFWKQAGIYGLEFLAAGAGAFCSLCGAVILTFLTDASGAPTLPQIAFFCLSGVVCNTFLTGSTTWITGRTFKQKGCWWKAAIGAGIGSTWGYVFPYFLGYTSDIQVFTFTLITPSLGAVVVFNL